MMKNKKYIFIAMSIALGTFFFYTITLYVFLPKLDDRAAFGDSFGALNTIISGLAFAGIIYTIFLQQSQLKMQSEELVLQRKELELTRKELKRSASAQEKSEQALAKQVENFKITSKITMYNALLNAYSDIINNKIWGGNEVDIRDKILAISKKLEQFEIEESGNNEPPVIF